MILFQPEIKEKPEKSIANAAEEFATQLVAAFDIEPMQTRFIASDHHSRGPEKCPPGATAEHERLHERSFCLDGVVQIVSCPGVQHLCQSDDTQRGMLFRPS